MVFVRNKDDSQGFTVRVSQELTQAVNIYCETIEIESKQFIRDAIVEKLIRTYVELKSEDYIYLGDKFPEVKKPLKKSLEAMKLVIEMRE